MAQSVDMDVNRLPSSLCMTVKIHLTREYRWRMLLGKALLWLAGWVMGCGVKFEGDGNADAG